MDYFRALFSQDLVPHGFCISWRPEILWLHVLSDAGIVIAYYSIPLTLLYFVKRRKDVPYPWLIHLFIGFIFACGTSHALSIWTMWKAAYGVEGVVKAVTAGISLTTAALLLPLTPKLLALRSPEELERLNRVLEQEAAARLLTEQDLRRARAELEERVLERTEELRCANESLEREMAERKRSEEERRAIADKLSEAQRMDSLGVLAGGVAHDFNNLLTVILGQAALARQCADTGPEAQAALMSICDAAHSAADLTTQMLAYAGRGSMELESLDISRSIAELAPLVAAALPRQSELQYHLAENLPGTLIGRSQFRQIVLNLVLNASDAMQGKAGAIHVTTSVSSLVEEAPATFEHVFVRSESAACVVLEVSDGGEGLDPQIQKRVFDPFFTTKFTGRGLGLGVVLGIVRSREGAVRITSQPEAGARFRVLLPATDAPAPRRTPATKPSSRALSKGETILVVDDEDAVRMVVQQVLEHAGYRVLTADGGSSALEILSRKADQIAIVLLDVTMPVMNGLEVCQKVRSIGLQVPVILSSGFDASQLELDRSTHLFDGFLCKPYTPTELVDAVRRTLDR